MCGVWVGMCVWVWLSVCPRPTLWWLVSAALSALKSGLEQTRTCTRRCANERTKKKEGEKKETKTLENRGKTHMESNFHILNASLPSLSSSFRTHPPSPCLRHPPHSLVSSLAFGSSSLPFHLPSPPMAPFTSLAPLISLRLFFPPSSLTMYAPVCSIFLFFAVGGVLRQDDKSKIQNKVR